MRVVQLVKDVRSEELGHDGLKDGLAVRLRRCVLAEEETIPQNEVLGVSKERLGFHGGR